MKRKTARILIVEDNPDTLGLVTTRLRISGYEIIAAEDGETAIEKCRQKKPDLLALDLSLPGIDGFEVCRVLKSDPGTYNIPIVILSARSQKSDKERAINLGAEAYIVKPYEPRMLLDEIKKILKDG